MNLSDVDFSQMIALLRDVLEGITTAYPVPNTKTVNRMEEGNDIIAHGAPTYCVVSADTLTVKQKRYLADILEYVSDKCLEKVVQLTSDTPELLLERRKEFFRTVKRAENNALGSP